ncbi:unnamed protein product [Caretta caretta]
MCTKLLFVVDCSIVVSAEQLNVMVIQFIVWMLKLRYVYWPTCHEIIITIAIDLNNLSCKVSKPTQKA